MPEASDQLLHCTITGAGGFIGRHLIATLRHRGHPVAAWSRASGFDLNAPSPDAERRWTEQLRASDVVVHLAGRAHVLDGDVAVERELHRRINFDGTVRLAQAAAAAGIRRFIFVSSAKVFGEGKDGPYSAQSPARPQDAYAQSKWNAEQALHALAAQGSMEVVIVRPPLVYGPGVGANFARLARLASLPIPLPFAAVDNRRDLIAVDNLVDLLARCVAHPAAAGATLLCSDGHPYSLADLLTHLRAARGRPRRLFPLPAWCLEQLASLGMGADASRRLFGNFELDIAATRALLDWQPPLDMPTALRQAAKATAP